MKNIFDVLPKLKKIRQKKLDRLKAKTRIDCLFEKFYAYNPDIKVPYPNLFADTLIRQRFGDSWELGNVKTVIEIMYILNNQDDPDIAHQTPIERENAVNKFMIGIPAEAADLYQRAIMEMFSALKKNSNLQILGLLEKTKEILDRGMEKENSN